MRAAELNGAWGLQKHFLFAFAAPTAQNRRAKLPCHMKSFVEVKRSLSSDMSADIGSLEDELGFPFFFWGGGGSTCVILAFSGVG